jgi:hypothetical protein
MAASPTSAKEIAITIPLAAIVADGVRIILTIDGNGERVKVDAVTFPCITLGLVNLTDHAIIHGLRSFQVGQMYKKRHAYSTSHAGSTLNVLLKSLYSHRGLMIS